MSTTTGTQAVDRAALLVATVVRADEPLSFAELQDECGLPKSTTSRLLTALERTELIERNDTGSYVAGPLFWLYATRHDPWDELVRLARPTLEKVGAETGETVNLSVARGDRVVQVAQVDSTYLLGTRDWTEVDVPAHCSALGKVLLAYGVIDVPDRCAGAAHTGHRSPTASRSAKRWTRTRGAATRARSTSSRSDSPASSAPVRGAAGEVVAALGISGPSPRLVDRRDEVGRLLNGRAEQLSALLRQTHAKGGRGMTPEEILQGLYDETLVGNAPARARADPRGAGHEHGAAVAALRRADPVAGGGRRPVRARRLLRAGDADRRPRDGRRDGGAASAARRDRRRDRRQVPDGHGQGRRARHRQEPRQHHARGRRLRGDRPRRPGRAGEVRRRDQRAPARHRRASRRSSPPRCRCSRPT